MVTNVAKKSILSVSDLMIYCDHCFNRTADLERLLIMIKCFFLTEFINYLLFYGVFETHYCKYVVIYCLQ